MHSPSILTSEIEVNNRLSDFGFIKQDLIDVAIAAVSARFESVEMLDPAGTKGTFSYIYGTRALRRMLLSKQTDWELNSEGQIAGAASKNHGVKFVFQNTDSACCIDKTPKAISGKGPAASKQVTEGHTMDMFPDSFGDLPSTQSGSQILWFLCVALHNDEPVMELYCPQAIENKQFYGVVERIFILHPGELEPLREKGEPDEMADFDVEVTKKAK